MIADPVRTVVKTGAIFLPPEDSCGRQTQANAPFAGIGPATFAIHRNNKRTGKILPVLLLQVLGKAGQDAENAPKLIDELGDIGALFGQVDMLANFDGLHPFRMCAIDFQLTPAEHHAGLHDIPKQIAIQKTGRLLRVRDRVFADQFAGMGKDLLVFSKRLAKHAHKRKIRRSEPFIQPRVDPLEEASIALQRLETVDKAVVRKPGIVQGVCRFVIARVNRLVKGLKLLMV